MQIILIQNDIEEAIKDYINKRLTVADGTDIQIDLSATRGAEGIKAIIDLVPATPAAAPAPTGTAKRGPKTNIAEALKDVPVTKAEQPKTPTVVVVNDTNAAKAPAVTQPIQESTEAVEVTEDTQDEAAGASEEAETEAVAVAPATPPVRSLFANLRKPVNQ